MEMIIQRSVFLRLSLMAVHHLRALRLYIREIEIQTSKVDSCTDNSDGHCHAPAALVKALAFLGVVGHL